MEKQTYLLLFIATLVGESIGYIIGTTMNIKSISVLFATGIGVFFSLYLLPSLIFHKGE